MKRIATTIGLTILMMSLLVVSACGNGNDGNGNDANGGGGDAPVTIVIGHAPYDYEEPAIEVTKILADELGYEVEIMDADIGFLFAGLDTGDIDIWPGVWLPSIHKTYQEQYGDKYELGSEMFPEAPIGWAVPSYVEGIDSIEDLKGNEDKVNGKVIGLEPGAGMMLVSEQIIDELDLELELVSGSIAGMLAEAEYLYSQKEPFVILGWRPHPMVQKFDLTVIMDQEGLFEADGAFWGIRHGFEEKAPEIYSLVKNFKMSLEDHEDYLLKMEEGGDPVEWAQNWIKENRTEIDKWLGK